MSSPAGGCSGSLIHPDWVLTATHCIDFNTPGNNQFSAPRTAGGLDTRTGITAVQIGTSDLTLVRLSAVTSGMTWPSVVRAMSTAAPSSLVGQTVTCYGRGNTTYASPSGLSGFGNWRTLTKTVASFDGTNLVANATAAGSEITAPGDSGGGCFVGGNTVAVVSAGSWNCADPTDGNTCKATITKVNVAYWRSTNEFASYIDTTPSRQAATFAPLVLQNGWVNAPFATNNAAVAVGSGIVQLRGAIGSGTSSLAFNLPAAYRPSTDVYVPINLCNATKGRLYITPAGDVNVQTEGAFSDAQCFTSLEGASFAVNNSGFTALALQNGWGNAPFSTRNAAVKNISGVIRFEGAVSNGTTTQLFTLPAGFRPPTMTYVPIDLCNAKKGRLNITSAGVVTVQAETAFTDAQCFTSLEGASFALAATGFTALSLQNSWTNAPFSTRNAAVTNNSGVVRFQGAIATTGTNSIPFTLPQAFRPATNVYIPVDLCAAAKGRILIEKTGVVTVQPVGAFSTAQCFTSLESVSFGL